MNHRLLRVREVIKRELSTLIERDLSFKANLVTVRSVDITPDLRRCHVYIGVIGNDEDKKSVISKLTSKRSQLQKDLSKRVILKYTPHLSFHLDESAEYGSNIEKILHELDLSEPAIPQHADDLNDENNEHDE